MKFMFLWGFVFLANIMSGQINLNKLKNAATKAEAVITTRNLSKDEVIKGLKEALIVGTRNAVANAESEGGFNRNFLIKIQFPEEAKEIKNVLEKAGMQPQLNKFEYTLNEAAEDAAHFAKEIFIDAVRAMNISDAISILKGSDNAATNYLRYETSEELYIKFKPVVKNSIEKVNLLKYWNVLAERYNAIRLVKQVNTDLVDYVTMKAIDGLFILIAQEEKNIRNNPSARVSKTLQKVFK